MPTNEEQLQLEWRAAVLNKLNSLEAGQAELAKDIAEIKLNFVKTTEIAELKADIEKLKLWKAKAVGVIVALNCVALFIGWLIQSYIFARH